MAASILSGVLTFSGPPNSSRYASVESFSTVIAIPRADTSKLGPARRFLGLETCMGSTRLESVLETGYEQIKRRPKTVRATGDLDDTNRDDEGVMKDMEFYVDNLSLEYDSVWDTKPAWCQPWTIVSTGIAIAGGSWLTLQNTFITGGVCLLISAWWFIFLYSYPQGYSEMIAERRRLVKEGSEDTFGTRRPQ